MHDRDCLPARHGRGKELKGITSSPVGSCTRGKKEGGESCPLFLGEKEEKVADLLSVSSLREKVPAFVLNCPFGGRKEDAVADAREREGGDARLTPPSLRPREKKKKGLNTAPS